MFPCKLCEQQINYWPDDICRPCRTARTARYEEQYKPSYEARTEAINAKTTGGFGDSGTDRAGRTSDYEKRRTAALAGSAYPKSKRRRRRSS